MDNDKKQRKTYKSLKVKRKKINNKLKKIDYSSAHADRNEEKLKVKLTGYNAEIKALEFQMQRPTTYKTENKFTVKPTIKKTTNNFGLHLHPKSSSGSKPKKK